MHPGARGTSFLLFTVAILVANQWWLLLVFLLAVLVGVGLTPSRGRILGVTLKALVPAIAFLSLVRLWVVADPVSETAITGLRLLELGLAFQLLFVPLDARQLMAAFHKWKFPAASGTLWLSAISSSHDLRQKYVQAHEAMLARGLISDELSSRLKAMPTLLQTVFINSVRGAIGRVDLWHERSIVERLRSNVAVSNGFRPGDALVIAVTGGCLIGAVALRIWS